MVEEPRQAIERNIAVDLLEHVKHARDGLVVSGVQTERPALFHQVAHHRFQLLFHGQRQVRAGLEEVFKVRRREHQHFAGPVMAQVVIALMQGDAAGPVLEIAELFLGLLGEQVVGDAHRQLLILGQLLDHRVVIGVVLEAAAGIDGAGQAQAIEFPHELAGGVDLVFQRQFRALGQGRIQDHRVRPRHQHAGGVAVAVAHDLTARRVRRVLGVARHPQGCAVEQGAVVQVQHEHRGVRGGLVEFFQGGHALFGELEFVPTAHHAYPLRRGRAVGLVLEHAQGIGQGRHAFPAQFKVVVQPATNQVQVRVVEAGNYGAALEVDDLGAAAAQGHGFAVGTHGDKAPLVDGHGGGAWVFPVHGVELAIEQNQIGVHRVSFTEASSQGANRRVAAGISRYTTSNTMVRVTRKVETT